jgi:phenazine biosynthesis protein phzE
MELAAVEDAEAYALLHRPRSGPPGRVEVLLGTAHTVDRVADVDGDALVVLPYRQLAERGLACVDDGTPMVAIGLRARGTVGATDLPQGIPVLHSGHFVPDDAAYAEAVRRILADEIGRGEGSNFVLRRSYRAVLANHGTRTALGVFRRLLAAERGAYWTFLVHWPGRTLIGASPERHVSLRDGIVTMNPVSGTYRYPPGGPTATDLARFLADRKETEELYMVLDEELKTLGRICPRGARVSGPRLTEMAHLAHTEYTVAGRTELEAREVLRETMFAPTVIGSPLPNACRTVARYEGRGRGYYGGALALFEGPDLDAAITIRTADIDAEGNLDLGVGATLVRRSDPDAEVAETRAKARGLLTALAAEEAEQTSAPPEPADQAPEPADQAPEPADQAPEPADQAPSIGAAPVVRHALKARNDRLSRFWLDTYTRPPTKDGRHVLIVDAGDAFTAMLAHQVRALGPRVTIRGYRDPQPLIGFDAVIVGPGPGDPRAVADPKIAALRTLTAELLATRTPLLSVCLGHQVLAALLGLPIRRRPVPAQGEQREIDFFGRREWVGFYNTFAAYADTDRYGDPPVQVCRDPAGGEVYGLRAVGVRSVQFHPESVLTRRGAQIVHELVTAVLADRPALLARSAGTGM